VVQAQPRRVNGKLDEALAVRIEELWAEQSERGNWTLCGQHTRNGLDRLLVRLTAQDGEVLVRIHEETSGTPTKFGVELIDAEALDMDYNDVLPNGNVVRMGVEFNRHRRPVAYHFFPEALQPLASTYRAGANQRERVVADDIVHLYLPEWAWQSRGMPWASTAIRRMAMLEGYEDAAITAARQSATKAAQYRYEEWADPGELPKGVKEQGQLTQDIAAGEVDLPPYGMYLQPMDWAWPNTDHGEFVKEALRGITAGLCINYNTGANDLEGVNYTSLRYGAQIERDLWMLLQDWYVQWFVQPIYRRWLAYAARRGLLGQKNGASLDLTRLRQFQHATFQPRRWAPVDPTKDEQAALMAVLLRRRSISSLIRQDGNNPDDVWSELRRDLDRLEADKMPPADQWPQPKQEPDA
jgi:lambda family phage portal protein